MSKISSNLSTPPQAPPDPRQASSAAAVRDNRPAPASPSPAAIVQAAAQETRATATPPATKAQPSAEELKRITEALQHRIKNVAPELQFSVDKESGRSILKITDRETNEIIRQIPSEEMLQINEALDRFQKGLLVDGQA